ncbi:MAG: acyl-CoA thioesterase [Spirochaetales bacterium]|nr:acyl-CoA thioesterase [Spirochaetales bacterium]
MKWLPSPIQIRFYEVDSYRIVNNMYYLSWFELGRFAVAEKAGIACPRFEDENLAFVVSSVKVEYRKPVRFGQAVCCESLIAAVTASKIGFSHRIRNTGNGELHASGVSEVICVKDAKMLLKLPAWVEKRVREYLLKFQGGIPG